MLRFIWGQLRGRAGRSVALMVGVLVATTGFVVLTGATTTSRLDITGAVERNTRAAYDILVRPKGTRTPLEAERRLVQPNYLSGLFGGITPAQYEQVRQIPGIDVAAPIAMLGYSTSSVRVRFDLTDAVDRSLERQVIRLDPTFMAERGLSTAPSRPRYVYVTKRPLIYPEWDGDRNDSSSPYSDGRTYRYNPECGEVPREALPGGRSEPICDPQLMVQPANGGLTSERESWSVDTVRLLPDGRFEANSWLPDRAQRVVTDQLVVTYRVTVPFLLAAVDPDAEQRLVGLRDAVTEGRPLRPDDTTTETPLGPGALQRSIPVLSTSRPYLDVTVRSALTRLPQARPAGLDVDELERTMRRATGIGAGVREYALTDGYRDLLAEGISDTGCCMGDMQTIIQAGAPEYERLPDGTLRAVARPAFDPALYGGQNNLNFRPRPWLADDSGFRPVTALPQPPTGSNLQIRVWRTVGVFDPEKLSGFSDLSRVPLETYEPPRTDGADERSRQALGGRPLEPSGNPAGYLSSPPLLLTSLAAVPKLLEGDANRTRTAPISAIRVRVTDVAGYTERSAERVRLVAERIADRTGLDVDLTFGSSPAPQTVELPAGSFGRPELRLTEPWSALGVASVITRAVDRKSVVLFLLVLVVCALFLGNAVSAAVRDRRPELAVLACLGWPVRRIGALILGEVALLGLGAGLLSLALAVPLGAALGIEVDWRRAALAVPVALLLALAAGAVPALRAARAHPAGALRPVVAGARRVRRPRTLVGLAVTNLLRTPGRTLLGAGALAIGVAALTLVTAAAYAFRGTIVGSLLGDVVSLSVRGADTAAAAATVLLGAAAVADVLYLNIRDRAAELATLRALGWTDGALARLVGYEGLALGVAGAMTGAAVGLGGAAWMIGGLPGALVLVATLVALGGVLVTSLAALVPTTLLRRLRTARLLAEE
ncbi:FtsX-like permease family protein [Micromonospora costi]|uniref:ABC transporter permease n=1 Tax=Micromonospora costi TaxID=1530042 RepID=A0A3B0A0T2_9ACTN|nr:FtsX-like permease family protein [Micromonospora costi]RKN54131.1 ABC transporter permease [Micromonospora costi]